MRELPVTRSANRHSHTSHAKRKTTHQVSLDILPGPAPDVGSKIYAKGNDAETARWRRLQPSDQGRRRYYHLAVQLATRTRTRSV